MTPDLLARVMEATWPPAHRWTQGPFTLRDGDNGGQRVSAASVSGAFTEDELDAAEAAMADPLFLILRGDTALDVALAARGYRLHDPVVAYAAAVAALAGDLPPLSAFPHWPPLEITRDLWVEGGIGAARVRVMDRVAGPKTAVLARMEDRPAGVAFVAVAGEEAMLHALEVRPVQRRRGAAAILLRAAANWAGAKGAVRLSLVVTEQNLAARALYTRAGMQVVGQYHYRMK